MKDPLAKGGALERLSRTGDFELFRPDLARAVHRFLQLHTHLHQRYDMPHILRFPIIAKCDILSFNYINLGECDKMKKIQMSDMKKEITCVADPVGRIFRSGDRLYRGINIDYYEESIEILKFAEKYNWFDRGLIETTVADICQSEYSLMLEHRNIRYSTQRGEWCAVGLQRAAMCHLLLCQEMLSHGYILKDAHSFNILFDGTSPKFIDFSSIKKLDSSFDCGYWFKEFYMFYLVPLLLFSAGETQLARSLTQELAHGAGQWIIGNDPQKLIELPLIPTDLTRGIELMINIISNIDFPDTGTEWHNYMFGVQELRGKDRKFYEVLAGIEAKSAIDIGANIGVHSQICAQKIPNVLACDIEEGCLNHLFRRAETLNLPITPLYMDITRPLGSGGIFGTQPDAFERLKSDLVIALALVHHVCFRKRLYVDATVKALANFSRKSAIIEFIPDHDIHVANWKLPPLDNYSVEGFRKNLMEYFESVEDIPFSDHPRRLFICNGRRVEKS